MSYFMKKPIFLILLLITLTSLAQAGYQERAIFLGEDDSPCTQGYRDWIRDEVYLEITVPGQPTIKALSQTTTTCAEHVLRPSLAI